MESSRTLPNTVSGKDEAFTDSGDKYIRFFPEDEERMEEMTIKEIISFKRYLIEKGRYYHEKD